MARLVTPEAEAEIDAAIAAGLPSEPAVADTRPSLDVLAGEIAELDAKIAEAQGSGTLPAGLPDIEAADRRRADLEQAALVGDAVAAGAERIAAALAGEPE